MEGEGENFFSSCYKNYIAVKKSFFSSFNRNLGEDVGISGA